MTTNHTLPFTLSSTLIKPITKLTPSFSPTATTTRRCKKAPTIAMTAAADKLVVVVAPAVIVGGGRVGRALQEMGSGQDLVVKRGEAVPLDFEGPILVCTRNDDLEAVLDSTPKSRWNGTPLPCLNTIFFNLLILYVVSPLFTNTKKEEDVIGC